MLSGARDAQVKLETLVALRERFDDRLSADGMALFVHALEGNANVSRTPTAARWRSIAPPERSRPAGTGWPSGRFTKSSGQ